MDVAAEPPRIVFDGSESCPDAEHVQALLRETLSAARAPGRGWSVSMHVDGTTPHAVRAEGDIANDLGASVAHRVLAGSVGDCDGMARAVGVWASLVLEQALARARAAASPDVGSPAGATPAGVVGAVSPAVSATPVTRPAAQADAGVPWVPPVNPKIGPDAPLPTDAPAERTYEIGLSTFLMTGNGSNAVLGASPYAFLEAARGFFLRPALSVGQSLVPMGDASNANARWLGTRVDACARLPGNYMKNSALQLDLCGGAEGGLTYFQAAPEGYASTGAPAQGTVLPVFSLGPSLDLQGDLGSGWAVALRGIGGVNVVRSQFTDTSHSPVNPSLFTGNIELALSWRLR